MTTEVDTPILEQACTLPDPDRPGRVEEWRALIARATSVIRGSSSTLVELPPGAGLRDEAERLVAAEASCCGSVLRLQVLTTPLSTQITIAGEGADELIALATDTAF